MLVEVIGWGGAFALLFAYFLVSTRKSSSNSKTYHLLNLFGALGFIINSFLHGAFPSAALNVVWLLIAVYALYRITKRK